MLTLKDDRIIGWMKKGVLTEKEESFCVSVYGDQTLTSFQWEELSRLNRKIGKL